jgi:hypothetical protein
VAGARHHDVHVGVAGHVLDVFEIAQGRAIDDAHRNRGDRTEDRVGSELARGQQLADCVLRRDKGAGDGRGARAAIGLQDIAVEGDGALTQFLQVEHRPQGAADQPLDLLRAAALLAARQHAVFGGHPALAAAALVGRHFFFHRGCAQHAGGAEFDQHGTLGVDREAAGDFDRTELISGACAGSGGQRC